MKQSTSRGCEVASDGRTVWVNSGTSGVCLGRFSQWGIDIHHDIGQNAQGECLSCTHSPATLADWHRFVREMKSFYCVVVAKKHKPTWLEE